MSAPEYAALAIDSNFEINGIDAVYSAGGVGTPCKVIPAQGDVELGLEFARATIAKSQFAVRASEVASPTKGGVLAVAGVNYKVNNPPSHDDLRLVFMLECVKV